MPRTTFPVSLLLTFTAFAGISTAQPSDKEVEALKARLSAMEQKLERLLERNEQLEERVRELTPASLGAPTSKEPEPAVDEVARLAAHYLAQEEEKKKTKGKSEGKTDAKKGEKKEAKSDGKEYEVGKNLKMEGGWRNALWHESADKAFKWTVGGVTQFDVFGFNGDRRVINSIGQFNNLVDPNLAMQDGMAFRRARLRFSGLLWEQIEFFAQYEFAQALDLRRRTLGISPAATSPTLGDFDPGDNIGFNEVYMGFISLPVLGNVRIGRHRESLNFVTATADNNQVWLERGLMFDAFNGDFNFSNGVTVQRTYFEDRAYTLFGLFQANNNSNRGFYSVGDGEYAYDARFTVLPCYNEEEQRWIHLGVDYSYRNPHQQQVRYRARPMVRGGPAFLTPNLLNTGTIFTNDAQQIANLEFAMALGRFTFAAEGATSWVTNAYTGGLPATNGTLPAGVLNRGTYVAAGGYVEALYFLTPDHRRYRKDRPGYDRVIPHSTFYFLDGEHGRIFSKGAWEVGARYDYVDLTNSGINGGMGNAVTLALNWYLNPNARIQANYFWQNRIFNPADTSSRINGDVNGLGIRFNIDY